jgi:peptidoglycan/xylan/chitin deacetylase (PgdA/CDA1 family)
VVAFSYHRIAAASATQSRPVGGNAETLEQQLRLLRRHCDVLSTDQLTDQELVEPGRRVIVTVDDCYRDSYEVAFPLFAANGIPVTFFLVSGFVDGTATPWWDEIAWMVDLSKRDRLDPSQWWDTALPLRGVRTASTVDKLVRLHRRLPRSRGDDMLSHLASATGSGRRPLESTADQFVTWRMAREMAAAGMSFGGHTDTHPVLTTLPAADQRAEIERSLDRIATELGERPTTFAYPVGYQETIDSSTKAAASAAGVRLAFSNYGGYTRPSNWDPLDIRRVAVGQGTTEAAFRWTVGLPALFAPKWSRGR